MGAAAAPIDVEVAGAAGKLCCRVIGTFDRNEARPTSAPTFRNMALEVFDKVPQAERLALLLSRSGRALFFLFKTQGRWYDLGGDAVSIRRAG